MARILLVDDEKLARTLYGDYLTAVGHAVTAVGSLQEARAALAADRFDAVVTDLILPGGDGMEVLRHVRERHPGVEVVVITGLDKVAPAVRAIKSGAAEYLVKPVAPEALQHAVRRALTTRDLMQENASLRRHVAMLEAGQRIATTLDRDKLVATTATALQSMASASAVVLLERDFGSSPRLRLQGTHGLPSGLEEPLVDTLLPRLQDARTPQELEGLDVSYPRVRSVPAVEGDVVLGHAVLFFGDAEPEWAGETAGYLVRNWALALRNLGRFAAVEDLAYVDDLTRLFNTRYLHLVLDREVQESLQTQRPFSLLFLDLDHFKSINDTHGHLVGSKLLVETARVVKGCVRDPDVVARYGGDEYVVLLRNTDSGGALKVAERIRRTMETHHFLAREGLSLKLTTCIGVASFPEHARDKATLIDLSDRAMYRGKRGSRNVVYMAALDLEAPPAERRQGGPGTGGSSA